MGTTWSLQLVASSMAPGEVRREVEAILDRIVEQMSPWEPDSDLSRFNRAPPGTWLELPAEFATVLDYALLLAEDTCGAFDPTIAELVEAWGFGPGGAPTGHGEVAPAHSPQAWQRLAAAREGQCVMQPGGIGIDLCAVAKGYAVDCIAQHLVARDCRNFLVEIGGELRGEGTKPNGMPWWVEIEAPRNPRAEDAWHDTVIALSGLAVATSGGYRRCFDAGGKRRHHIIDPRTGYPADNDVLAVTVLDRQCMRADALATALLVLGEEEGMAFASARNIPALLVVDYDERIAQLLTPALAAMAE
jgi:thiamine biosynthesis lipoprotein